MRKRVGAILLAFLFTLGACTSGPSDSPPGTVSPSAGQPSVPTPDSPAAPICNRPATVDDPGLHAGYAVAPDFRPTDDPEALEWQDTLRDIVAAANDIADEPYLYGGGHQPGEHGRPQGYDASGAVSQALIAGDLLSPQEPLISAELALWGEDGEGEWLTVWANEWNAVLEIGHGEHPLWLRTTPSNRCIAGRGPRWTTEAPHLEWLTPRCTPRDCETAVSGR